MPCPFHYFSSFLSSQSLLSRRPLKVQSSKMCWFQGSSWSRFWFLVLAISGVFTIVGATDPTSVNLNHKNLVEQDGILAKSLKYFQNILSAVVLDEDSVTESPVPHTLVNLDSKEHTKEENSSSTDMEKLREEIRRRLAIYKSEVELVHDLGEGERNEDEDDNSNLSSRSKIRRAVITASNTLPGRRRRNITHDQPGGSQVVTRIYRRQPQPFDDKTQADLNLIEVKPNWYLFSIENPGSGSESLVIYKIEKDLNPREIIRRNVPGATTLEIVWISQEYYFIVGEYKETSKDPLNHGSHLYHINFERNKLTAVQTINTDYARSIQFWTGSGEEANDVNLCVAPEFTVTEKGTSNKVAISMYRWHGAHFDFVDSVTAYNPQAISYANIQSHGYLAVANYQDDTKSTNIYSEIFKYSHKTSNYLLHQRILSYGAKDIQHFSITAEYGEEHFLAIANFQKTDEHGKANHHVKSRIMKFSGVNFIQFQGLDTYGAFRILAVKEGRNKFLLVVADMRGLHSYQYNGWKFIQTLALRLCESDVLPHSISLRSFSYQNEPYLAIASQNDEVKGGIYNLEFKQIRHNELSSDVEKWCMAAWETMWPIKTENLVEQCEVAPKITDDEIILSSSLQFSKPLTAGSLFAKKMSCGEQVFDAQLSRQLTKRETHLKSLQQDAIDILVKLGQTVMRDRTQTINSAVEFTSVEYTGLPLKVGSVVTTNLNEFNVNDVLENAIDVNKDYEFNSVFIPKVTANGNTKINQLNGQPLTSYAVKSSSVPQTLTATNSFEEIVSSTGGLVVNGLIDGIDFHGTPDFLVNHINQTFRRMNVRDSVTNNLIADTVNGVNLKHYMDEAVSKSGDATITGRKEFESIDVKNWNLESLDGHIISALYDLAVKLDAPQTTFKGRKTQFKDLIAKSIDVSTGIANDHINIDKDLISTKSGTYNLESLEFQADIFVDKLTVHKFLNRIKVTDGKLDVILKSGQARQLISNKVLEGIVLEKDSEADGLVDNVQLKGWSNIREIILPNNHLNFGSLKTAGRLEIPNGIHVDPSTCTFTQDKNDVSFVLANALRLDAQKLPDDFKGKLVFDSIRVDGDTVIRDTINDQRTSDWLLKNPESPDEIIRITAKKTFDGGLTLLAPSTTQELYGSKERFAPNILDGLDDLLINGVDQNINGNSIFNALLQVNKLDCPNLVLNGIRFQDLFLTTGDQEIQGNVNFASIKINNEFKINGNLNVKTINRRDLSADILDTLRTSSSESQIVTGKFNFDKEFRATNLNIVDGLIGGENPNTLLDNIIQNDGVGKKRINGGSITFSGQDTILEQLRLTGTLNEIGHAEWGHGLMLSHGHQIVTAETRFKNSLIATGTITATTGKISNFDLLRFEKEYLPINVGGRLGVVYFDNKISVENGVNLGPGGTVNQLNLEKDVLLKNSEKTQIVTGNKVFKKQTTINGNLDVHHLHGFNFDQAAKFVFLKTSPADNLRIRGNLVLNDEIFFKDSFNGDLWSEICKGVWWLHGDYVVPSDAEFIGDITFQNGVELSGLLNGVDIVALSKDYLSKSKDQIIRTGPTVFESGVTFGELKVNKIHIANGEVNGISLEKFRDSVLLTGADQSISTVMSFENVRIQKIMMEDGTRVGGIDLSEHAMTLHGENIVTGKFTFVDLNVNKLNIANGTEINGIDLDEWSKNAAKINEHGVRVRSKVNFESAIFASDVQVHGLVDGLKFTRDNIFTLSDDQTVEGLYTFEQNHSHTVKAFLAPQGIIVDGLFNGFNLEDLIGLWVRDDGGTGPIDVFGVKTFNQEFAANKISAEGLFQEQDLNAVIRDLEAKTYITRKDYNFSLEVKYQELSSTADSLRLISDRKAVCLEYFESADLIQVQASRKVKSLTIFGKQKLIFLQQSPNYIQRITTGHYNEDTSSYHPDSTSLFTVTGSVQELVGIQRGNEYFIFMSVRSDDNLLSAVSDCQIEPGYEIEKSGKLSRAFLIKLHESEKEDVSCTIKQEIFADDVGNVATFVQFLTDGTARICATSLLNNTEGSKALILCFQKPNDQRFQLTQTLPAENPSLVNTMRVGQFTTILAIASNNLEEKTGVVDIWVHSKGYQEFRKEDCIPVVNLVSMDALRGFNDNAFLALASGYVQNSRNYGQVTIYRYSNSKKQFTKLQTISVDNPVDVRFQQITVSKESFLYILTDSAYHNLDVYSFRGKSGWILQHTLTVEGARSLGLASFELNKVFHAQLLVRSQNHVNVLDLEFNGLSNQRVEAGQSNTTLTLPLPTLE